MTSGSPSPFGALLRRYRSAARLTQEELAERAGISLRGLVALENGERLHPRRDTTRLLADALHLTGNARAHFVAIAWGRARAPGGAVYGRNTLPGSPDQTGVPLVGRDHERALLEQHLAGKGPVVLILAGEPGIGKTRLLRQASQLAFDAGRTVIDGGCRRRSGQEPYAPFPQALAAYFETLPADALREVTRDSPWLVRLLPELAAHFPDPGMQAPEGGQERRLLFDSVSRLLTNLAQPSGLVLLLDDLQWAHSDALDLLTALVHGSVAAHLRIVAAYRSTELRPRDPLALTLADLAHAGLARQAAVEALSPQEAEQLLAGLACDLRPPGDTVRQAVARTGGVPFYLVSYAQELRAKGAAPTGQVPWDVAHSIRQRVAALPEAAQEILAVAAIAGRVVSQAVVERAMGSKDAELLSALEMACQARLLEEAGGRAYRFPHDIVRETIEADLLAARRTLIHRKLGEALEQISPADAGAAAELAWHFLEAGDAERALPYSMLAGDAAGVMFAHEEAEKHYRTALALARELDDEIIKIEALLKLGAVLSRVGRMDEALSVLEEAAGHSRLAGNATAEARAIAQIGKLLERHGAIEDGIARLEPLLRRFEEAKDADAMHRLSLAELMLALGDLYYEAGRYPNELRVAEQAAELARQLGEDRILTDAERQRGLALISLGRQEEAVQAWTAALPLMDAISDLYNLSHTLSNLTSVTPDLKQAKESAKRALKAAERLGDPSMISLMTSGLGELEYVGGRWREARMLAERAWKMAGPLELLFAGYAALLLAEIDLAEGNVVEGRGWLETCVAISTSGDILMLRLAQQTLAEQDLREGHPQTALARLEPLLDRLGLEEEGVSILLSTLARTHLKLGDTQRAEDIAREGLRRARALGYQEPIAELVLVKGAIAAYNGRWENAEAAFDEALAVARRRPHPYAEGRILYEYGIMESRRGQSERAREMWEEGLLIFRRLGARPYEEQTEIARGALARDRRHA